MKKKTTFFLSFILLISAGCLNPSSNILKEKTLFFECPQYLDDAKTHTIEEMIDGDIIADGTHMSIPTNDDCAEIFNSKNQDQTCAEIFNFKNQNRTSWRVYLRNDEDAACRMGILTKDRFHGLDNPQNSLLDLYFDRPKDAVIVVSEGFYSRLNLSGDDIAQLRNSNILNETDFDREYDETQISGSDSVSEFLENRAKIQVIVYNAKDVNETLALLENLKTRGIKRAIIGEDESGIPLEWEKAINQSGMESSRILCMNRTSEWVKKVTGLNQSMMLNYDTKGECIYANQIQGGAENSTIAEKDMKNMFCRILEATNGMQNKSVRYKATLVDIEY